MPLKKEKAFFIFCLLALLLGIAGSVLALELDYPKIPGIGELEEGKPLGFYFSYFFKFTFYLVVAVCIVALIIGGILHIIAFDRMSLKRKARDYVRRALTGLFILSLAFVILAVVNPDLLKFDLKLKKIDTGGPLAGQGDKAEPIVAQAVPILPLASNILSGLGAKVWVDPLGRFVDINGYLTDGYGNYVDLNGNYLEEGQPRVKSPLINPSFLPFWDKLFGSALADDPTDQYVYQGEIPLLEIEKTIREALAVIDGQFTLYKDTGTVVNWPALEELLEPCQCGQSRFYVDWKGLDGQCIGGVKKDALPALESLLINDNLMFNGQSIWSKELVCHTACGPIGAACGQERDSSGALLCDLHKVRQTTTAVPFLLEEYTAYLVEVQTALDNPATSDIDESVWKVFDWQAPSELPPLSWSPPAAQRLQNSDNIKIERLVQYRVLRLQKILAQLEGHKQKFFPEQVSFVAKALSSNKAEFLMSQTWQALFNYDFLDYRQKLEGAGYEVIIKPFKGAGDESIPGLSETAFSPVPSQPKGLFSFITDLLPKNVLAVSPLEGLEAGTLYFILKAPEGVQDRAVTQHNQQTARDASRASLFSVLTDLSLEKIEEIFRHCLEAAFGQASYFINKEELEEILSLAMNQGAAAHFEAELDRQIGQALENTARKVGEEAQQDMEKELITKALQKCQPSQCPAGQPVDEAFLKELEDCGRFDIKTCCSCVNNVVKKGIPPNFVSDTIAKFFTTSLLEFLPNLKEALHKSIKEVLFPEGGAVDDFLDQQMVQIYNKVIEEIFQILTPWTVKAALTESFAQQIPALQQIMQTPMRQVLPDIVVSTMDDVDRFLECTIDGCCRTEKIKEGESLRDFYKASWETTRPNQPRVYRQPIESEADCLKETDFHFKEIYKEEGGKKQCCIEGMKQWVRRYSEDYLNALLKRYAGDPLHNWVQGKLAGWGLDKKDLNINQCYSLFSAGYVFFPLGAAGLSEFSNPSPNWVFLVPEGQEESFLKNLRVREFSQSLRSDLGRYQGLQGDCRQLTLEEINSMNTLDIYKREFLDISSLYNADPQERLLRLLQLQDPAFVAGLRRYVEIETKNLSQYRRTFCETAGYEWLCGHRLKDPSDDSIYQGFEETEDCRCYDRNNLTQDIEGALGSRENIEKTGRKIAAGLINYGERFLTALIETTVHTALEYARVVIEDKLILPFRASFYKITGFQKSIEAFLASSVKDNLPKQISGFLQSSIQQQIAKLCTQVQSQLSACPPEGEGGEVNITLTVDLPQNVTWKESAALTETFQVSCDTGRVFCRLSKHLQTTVLGALTEKFGLVGDILKASVRDYLNCAGPGLTDEKYCLKIEVAGEKYTLAELLNKPLARLLWTDMAEVEALIKGNPKQIICGERATYKSGTGLAPKSQTSQLSIKDKCLNIKSTTFGLIPTVNYTALDNNPSLILDGFGLPATADEITKARNQIVPWCYVIYSICQDPLAPPSGAPRWTYYQVIEKVVNSLCALADDKVDDFNLSGGSQCQSFNPETDDPIVDLKTKYGCRTCNSARYSAAQSLFYWSVRGAIGPISDRASDEEDDEKLTYRWLKAELPGLQGEIDKVSQIRNIPNQPAVGGAEPGNPTGLTNTLVSWIKGELDFKAILLQIPLGVIKPGQPGGQTLFLKSSAEGQNFLSKTPEELFTRYFCAGLEDEFENRYPDLAYDRLALGNRDRQAAVLPYSPASVDNFTIAKRLELIASANIEEGLRDGYLLCLILKKNMTIAQIFGFDQPLEQYIPVEFRILFRLIRDNLPRGTAGDCRAGETFGHCGSENDPLNLPPPLDNCCYDASAADYCSCCRNTNTNYCRQVDQRPPLLSKLLHYLYDLRAVDLLSTFGLTTAREFLDKPLSQHIVEQWPDYRTPIIEMFCATNPGLCDEKLPGLSTLAADKLKKTPLQLLAEINALKKPLFPDKGPFGSGQGIIDYVALQATILHKPYLDILGDWLGLTEPLFGASQDLTKVGEWVNEGVNKSINFMQELLEDVLIDLPRYLYDRLAQLLSGKMGEKAAFDIAGACRGPTAEEPIQSKDDCRANEIFRLKGDEPQCCTTGAALACFPRCRSMPNIGCEEILGEEETTWTNPLGIEEEACCYQSETRPDGLEYCRKCRPVNFQAGGQCRTQPDGTPIEFQDEILHSFTNQRYGVCCYWELCDPKATTKAEEKCCSTVIDCVMNRFAAHLEILAEMLAEGVIPLNSLKSD